MCAPEGDAKKRHRWPDEVRDDVLARLLELNGERAKAEAPAAARRPTCYGTTMTPEPNDLSPMVFDRIRHEGRQFELSPALRLDITLDVEGSAQLLVASDESLGIHAYATTREQLAEEIAEQVAFVWDHYAHGEESSLATRALMLRQAALQRMKEVDAERKESARQTSWTSSTVLWIATATRRFSRPRA